MELDFHDIKPSVFNALIILLTVMVVVPLARWGLNTYLPNSPFTTLINAV